MVETNVNIDIDSNSFAIKEYNRYKINSVKSQIVIATSLRKKNYDLVHLQHKEIGRTKTWNTFSIDREGKILQHYDDKYHTDFLGIKAGDKQSISIVLQNMGSLYKLPDNTYVNWLNEKCESDRVIEKKWLGYKYWEIFDENQINALAELCSYLCEKHNIPKEVIDFRHYHKEIHKYRGIVFRSNYIEDSSDINPLINLNKLNELINRKEHER